MTATAGDEVRVTAVVQGDVQGVGFRAWVRDYCTALGLRGRARNMVDGDVEVIAVGSPDACRKLLDQLRGPDAPGRVTAVRETWG